LASHEFERQEVGLLVMADCRDISGRSVDYDAAIEFSKGRYLVHRQTIVDYRLHSIDMRRQEIVVVDNLKAAMRPGTG
jgi:hypothetical protein